VSLLAALARHRDPVEERALSASQIAWARGEDFANTDSATGVQVTRDTALGVSAVWACVSLIANALSTLPVDVVDAAGKPSARPGWLDAPNPEQTRVDFIFGTIASLLLEGFTPTYTLRDRKGEVIETYALDPRWVQVRREYQSNGALGLVYYVMVGKGMQSPVGPFRVDAGPEMFHVNAFMASSSWPRGIAPLEVARRMFGSGIAGQEMGASFFGHGMNAAGVIEVPDDLTIDQARELKSDFMKANAGIPKMHLPPVLTANAKFKQIQINPEQAQFIEQRKFSVEEICRFFGVPPHMVAAVDKSTSWGTGIEQQSIGFVRYTLRPWLERIEEAWTRHMLLFQPGDRFRFNVDGLLRGDAKAQADYAQSRFQTGWTHNDVRDYFGEDHIDDGDTAYFPVNMAPVGTEPLKIAKVDAEEPDLKEPITGDVSTVPSGASGG
jgi:HK97 family phage portal protein